MTISDELADEFKNLVIYIQKIFAPTLFIKNIYLEKTKKWPDLNKQLETKIHVVPNPDFEIHSENIVISPIQNTFKIAFLGNFCLIKGSDKFNQLSTHFKEYNGINIEYHIFGSINDHVQDHITCHGKYNSEQEVISQLHQNDIHLILFLWSWPESWSYTLTLALMSGIPICYPNLGAYKERMDNYHHKRFLKYENQSDMINAIQNSIEFCKMNNNIFQYKKSEKIIVHNDYSEIWS
jgi:hypothetical protein